MKHRIIQNLALATSLMGVACNNQDYSHLVKRRVTIKNVAPGYDAMDGTRLGPGPCGGMILREIVLTPHDKSRPQITGWDEWVDGDINHLSFRPYNQSTYQGYFEIDENGRIRPHLGRDISYSSEEVDNALVLLRNVLSRKE